MEEKLGFFQKLKQGLSKTKKGMMDKLEYTFSLHTKVDDALLEEIEEVLISSDVGFETSMHIVDELREVVRLNKISETDGVKEALKTIISEKLNKGDSHGMLENYPLVILVVGVNGVGKTTSIAKIANQYLKSGKTVMLAAGDTFRAAASDQLKVWGERLGIRVISNKEGSDPASVVFDAIDAAKAKDVDVLICDTAGRLHNKKNLMSELEKIHKIINREYPEATKETLLVIDAGTGRNALSQVKAFYDSSEVTGLVLTKLDGTAKGGVIISIADTFDMPVKFVGVGEGMDDLQVFDPESFAKALFES